MVKDESGEKEKQRKTTMRRQICCPVTRKFTRSLTQVSCDTRGSGMRMVATWLGFDDGRP